MSNENTEKKPSFDPVKLEQVNVNVDYPMEPDEFEILYKHNCYCHMAHISKFGYPIVTPMFYVVLEDGFIYISSVVNNDAAVACLATLTLWLCLRLVQSPASRKYYISLGAVLGLA